MPRARSAEDRAESRLLTGTTVELQVIDSSAATPIDIDKLVVEDSVNEVHVVGRHQAAPPSVTRSRGIAATETSRMMTKYTEPTALARMPLAWSTMTFLYR